MLIKEIQGIIFSSTLSLEEAEALTDRVSALIERLEKAEAERVKLKTKVYGYQERDRFTTLEQTRLNERIRELEAQLQQIQYADEQIETGKATRETKLGDTDD